MEWEYEIKCQVGVFAVLRRKDHFMEKGKKRWRFAHYRKPHKTATGRYWHVL